ncbi:MAG: hypothetical protein Q9218_006803 [Villophora microphyllina]
MKYQTHYYFPRTTHTSLTTHFFFDHVMHQAGMMLDKTAASVEVRYSFISMLSDLGNTASAYSQWDMQRQIRDLEADLRDARAEIASQSDDLEEKVAEITRLESIRSTLPQTSVEGVPPRSSIPGNAQGLAPLELVTKKRKGSPLECPKATTLGPAKIRNPAVRPKASSPLTVTNPVPSASSPATKPILLGGPRPPASYPLEDPRGDHAQSLVAPPPQRRNLTSKEMTAECAELNAQRRKIKDAELEAQRKKDREAAQQGH